MNLTLYKKEWRCNWVLLIIFMAVLSMYAGMIIAMFDPKMGDSLKVMAESMPEVFAAFGMAEVGQTLLEFITGYLYGILLTAFPAVYIIILSGRLVASYVDNGSFVYILSSPDKRGKIIRTQAIYLLTCLIVMLAYVMLLILIMCQVMFPDELDVKGFIVENIGLFGLWIMFAGICFACSCIFNESRKAIGVSSAIIVYSVLVQMISQVGDKFENIKYATPLSLFSAQGLVDGKCTAWVCTIVMYLVGIALFIAGEQFFKKKDLPI